MKILKNFHLSGAQAMMLSGLCFATMTVPVRMIGNQLPSLEKAFFRNMFAWFVIIAIIWAAPKHKRIFKSKNMPLQILRALLGVGAMSCFFIALDLTSLAKVTASSYINPLLITVGAVIIYHEKIRIHRTIALIVGFFGVLVMTHFALGIDKGMAYALVSCIFMAGVGLVIKRLSQIDPPDVTVFWMGAIMTPISFIMALPGWVWPNMYQIFLLIIVGALATFAQQLLMRAYKVGEVTEILPYDFLRLIWASIYGFVLFNEKPEINIYIGAAIILASAVYIAWREQISKRNQIAKLNY